MDSFGLRDGLLNLKPLATDASTASIATTTVPSFWTMMYADVNDVAIFSELVNLAATSHPQSLMWIF